MLTLTRAVGESIVLSIDGKTIATMQLVCIRGREAKVSFNAPGVKILRGELRHVEDANQHQGLREGATRGAGDSESDRRLEDCGGTGEYRRFRWPTGHLPDQPSDDASSAGEPPKA